MLISGLVLALFAVPFFADDSLKSITPIHEYTAIAAGITFVAALVTFFWSPRHLLVVTAVINYALLLATLSLLLATSEQLEASFVSIWAIAIVFSPLFAYYGILLAILSIAGTVSYSWTQPEPGADSGFIMLITAILALAIGLVGLWHKKANNNKDDLAYHKLSTKLSAASSMSDIIISAIDDGVVATDGAGKIQLINPAAQRLLGWKQDDALGIDVSLVIKMVDNQDHPVENGKSPIENALQTNKQAHVDNLSLVTADAGKKFPAAITASPLGNVGSGLIVVFRDITKERAEGREQSEFISTASHEMRTPVASIEGYLGLALNPNTAQVDERARDFITKAQESAQHLGRLFQDLLDVSRAEDGRLNSDPRVVDVVPFFRDIVVGLLANASAKNLRVNYKPMPNIYADTPSDRVERVLPPILYAHVDNDHLREVLSNLFDNAIKYTDSGTITVDVVGTDEHITISITDTGIGIPKEDIGHLFQKFYRVDNSATREIGGTGLGLYLCRKLTESMGGTIWADSTYKQGSTFYVRLPRLEHTEAMALIEKEAAAPIAIQNVHTNIFDDTNNTPEPVPNNPSQPEPQPTITEAQPITPVSQIQTAQIEPITTQSGPVTPPVEQTPEPQQALDPNQLPVQPIEQPQPTTAPEPPSEPLDHKPVIEPGSEPEPMPEPAKPDPAPAPTPPATQPETAVVQSAEEHTAPTSSQPPQATPDNTAIITQPNNPTPPPISQPIAPDHVERPSLESLTPRAIKTVQPRYQAAGKNTLLSDIERDPSSYSKASGTPPPRIPPRYERR